MPPIDPLPGSGPAAHHGHARRVAPPTGPSPSSWSALPEGIA